MTDSMRRRYWILLSSCAVFVVFVSWHFCRQTAEPSYQQKPLSAWLTELDTWQGDSNAPVMKALRHFGTNALPALVEALRAKDSRIEKRLFELASRQSLIRFNFPTPIERFSRAMIAFHELGPLTTPAIPALVQLLDDRDPVIRFRAACALGAMRANADPAIPALLRKLDDPEGYVRSTAAEALGVIRQRTELVVPALIRRVADTNHYVRLSAIHALGLFKEKATDAVPALVKAKDEKNDDIRSFATSALNQIAPEAASGRK